MTTHRMRRPDDFHLHLRSAEMLRSVAKWCRPFGRVLVMPNLFPHPILTGVEADNYRSGILRLFEGLDIDTEPLMTIQITHGTTPQMVIEAYEKYGVIAGKVYPKGQTTNSDNGVTNFTSLHHTLRAMAECGMVLCIHGESTKNNVSVIDREEDFLKTLQFVVEHHPKLKIVMEHITTAAAVNAVKKMPAKVAATITAHHLVLTLNDVIDDKLHPHHFCKPIAKRESDRLALVQAATSGNAKFFFGSDSAPHLRAAKEASACCAGIFSAPTILPVLMDVFFEAGANLNDLEGFTSKNGARFYNLPMNDDEIELIQQDFTVEDEYNGIVPFMAGKTLKWCLA